MTTDADIKKQVKRALEEEKPTSRLGEKKKAERKKRRRQYLYIAGGLLFAYMFYLLLIPYKGGNNFGVCKVFLQLYVPYPDHLRLSTVEDFGNSYRIWFSSVDGFGEYRLDHIHCFYRSDPNTGFALEKVTIGRREVDQKIIDRFNPSIPTIVHFPPDLTYPYPIPDSLADIEIKTDEFRRKLFR